MHSPTASKSDSQLFSKKTRLSKRRDKESWTRILAGMSRSRILHRKEPQSLHVPQRTVSFDQILTGTTDTSAGWCSERWKRFHSRCKWCRSEFLHAACPWCLVWTNPVWTFKEEEEKHQMSQCGANTSMRPNTHQQDCKWGQVVAATDCVGVCDVDHKAAVGSPASFLTFTEKKHFWMITVSLHTSKTNRTGPHHSGYNPRTHRWRRLSAILKRNQIERGANSIVGLYCY